MNTLTPAEKNEGWQLLFDGETLQGWDCRFTDHGWQVVDGAIVAVEPKGGRYLYTTTQYADFELSLEFCLEEACNSGVFIRWSDVEDPINTGLEIQLLDRDDTGAPNKQSTGAIYDLVAPVKYAGKAAGTWNSLVVKGGGPMISVTLNGVPVTEMNIDLWDQPYQNPDGTANKFKYAWRDLPRQGHVGLQNYGANKGQVLFRNIKVKPLA